MQTSENSSAGPENKRQLERDERARSNNSIANLTDDDLLYEEGKEDELYSDGSRKKTGQTKEEIKRWIDKL
jgi:hypothetical protein